LSFVTNSVNGSKGGRPKKNPIESEIKPNENPIESETKGIREDNIKVKDSKAILENRSNSFKESLKPYKSLYGVDMLKSFFDYWTEPNKSNTKMRFELEKTWSIDLRLKTWAKRQKDFQQKQNIKIDRL